MHASNHTWSLMTLGNSMITNHRGSHCFKMAIPLFFFTIIKTHYQHRKAVVICQMTKWKLWSHDKWSKLSGGKTFTKVNCGPWVESKKLEISDKFDKLYRIRILYIIIVYRLKKSFWKFRKIWLLTRWPSSLTLMFQFTQTVHMIQTFPREYNVIMLQLSYIRQPAACDIWQ